MPPLEPPPPRPAADTPRHLTATYSMPYTPAACYPTEQVQAQNLLNLVHRKPLLGHRLAPLARRGEGAITKDLRRAPGSDAGDERAGLDVLSFPQPWRTVFRSNQQTVRHHTGPVSAMRPERCPPSLRNRVRHAPARAGFDDQGGNDTETGRETGKKPRSSVRED